MPLQLQICTSLRNIVLAEIQTHPWLNMIEDKELIWRIQSKPQSKSLARFFPILGWLPKYERSWLRSDLIAGLTVVALLIPEGMAYAQIAGMPPQTAFYAAPIGLLAFAIFGTSRQLVVAVSAIIATMSFATVSLIAPPNTTEFYLLTAALAVLAGLIAILAGLLKLGRVAQFFSESVMVGFITGLALVIMVKQLPKILGIEGGQWQLLGATLRYHHPPGGNPSPNPDHRCGMPDPALCPGAFFP